MIQLQPTDIEIPEDILAIAYNFGCSCTQTNSTSYKAIQTAGPLYILICKNIDNVITVKIITLHVGVVVATRKINTATFPLTDLESPQYTSEINKCIPLTLSTVINNIDILRGNFHISSDCDNVYSISAPIHHLADDISRESIPTYTRYAWTTNVTITDIYTTFSEYVYKNNSIVYTGTLAPPEPIFKHGIILGIGINNTSKKVHLAQLVEINTGFGYWRIKDKLGVDLGVFFGNEDSCKKLVENTLNTYTSIWINNSNIRWWYEFFEAVDNIQEITPNLNIYNRIAATRIGACSQWFYINDEWVQYQHFIKTKFKFHGLNTEPNIVRYTLNDPEFNGFPITLEHEAKTTNNSSGDSTDLELPIYRKAIMTIPLAYSSIVYRENINMLVKGDKLHIGPVDKCNQLSVALTGTLSSLLQINTIVESNEYVVENIFDATKCSNSIEISGDIVIKYATIEQKIPIFKAGTQQANLSISLTSTPPTVGTRVIINSGIQPYTFNMSGGTISKDGVITALDKCHTGNGSISVNDSCGNSNSIQFTSGQAALSIILPGDVYVADGYVGVSGGIGPYTYSADGGTITADGILTYKRECSESGESASTSVTVTDSCGNTATAIKPRNVTSASWVLTDVNDAGLGGDKRCYYAINPFGEACLTGYVEIIYGHIKYFVGFYISDPSTYNCPVVSYNGPAFSYTIDGLNYCPTGHYPPTNTQYPRGYFYVAKYEWRCP